MTTVAEMEIQARADRDEIRRLRAEVERLREVHKTFREAAEARVRDLEAQVESVVAQRDGLTRELLEENERHAATAARVRTLEEALTEAHKMLQGAWALLPPEDGERLGIKAYLIACERPDCAALREEGE